MVFLSKSSILILMLHQKLLFFLVVTIIKLERINSFSFVSSDPLRMHTLFTNSINSNNNKDDFQYQNLLRLRSSEYNYDNRYDDDNDDESTTTTTISTLSDTSQLNDLWERTIQEIGNPYRSNRLFQVLADDDSDNDTDNTNDTTKNNNTNQQYNEEKWNTFIQWTKDRTIEECVFIDPLWEQVRLEAQLALQLENQAGPQLYQGILSQSNLITAIVTIIAHEIASPLIPATAIKNLFLEILIQKDIHDIRYDLQAVSTRSPSVGTAMDAILFHNGYHALVCYRVAHRLWLAGRTGLAYFIQSVVSRTYSADIHPACTLGYSLYVRVGGGVVIGETATVGNDVTILEGVTLGGTGKETGNRHPKVHDGVIIYDGGTVLGNIIIGTGCVVTAKSIVTKPIPPLAIVNGVPARIQGYRQIQNSTYINNLRNDPLQEHLIDKYWSEWSTFPTE
jgi:serine O-acetyltransferase